MESIALKAAMTMPALLLQRPHRRSRNADHISLLKDRLARWKCRDNESLLHEGNTIQSRLKQMHDRDRDATSARTFARLMEVGNVKAAIRMVSDGPTQGSLSLNSTQPDGRTIKEHLLEKHPARAEPISAAIQATSPEQEPHQVIFNAIDGALIRSITLRTTGSAGPSGLDSAAWRRLCSSFGTVSNDLCNAIANLAKRICTSYIDPRGLMPLVASRLIALDKNPGVNPIGVGEVLR